MYLCVCVSCYTVCFVQVKAANNPKFVQLQKFNKNLTNHSNHCYSYFVPRIKGHRSYCLLSTVSCVQSMH